MSRPRADPPGWYLPGGRPRVFTRRDAVDYPAGNPLPTPCRIWQGPLDRDGYGRVHLATHQDSGRDDPTRRTFSAHRWVYETVYGPIPPRIVIRHRCDNPPCFRLDHLEPGTVAENNRDAQLRGHLGTALSLSPSELSHLFDMREAGMTYPEIHRMFAEKISYPSVKRIGKRGRAFYNDVWGLPPEPEPISKYQGWRNNDPRERDNPVRSRSVRPGDSAPDSP